MTEGKPLSFESNLLPSQSIPAVAPVSNVKASEFYIFPLSPAQEGVWLMRYYIGEDARFNLNHISRLSRPNDIALLLPALNELVARHEALRTYFPFIDGQLLQVVANQYTLTIEEVDLTGVPSGHAERELHRIADEHAALRFDIDQFPLFRLKLVRLTDDDSALIITAHHMIADPWSIAVLWRELQAVITAYRNGEPARLAPLPVQYGDYARWQHKRMNVPSAASEHLQYWTNKLAGARPIVFPGDRTAREGAAGSTVVFRFSLRPSLVSSLRALSHRAHATLFITLLGAFYSLVSRHTSETDIVVGSYLAGRNRAEVEQLVGLFSNAIALRVDNGGNPRFIDLLERVKDAVLDAYVHQEVPLASVMHELQISRGLGRHPLFDIVFQMLNWPVGEDSEFTADPPRLAVEANGAVFDMTWSMWESGNVVKGRLEYNSARFDASTIRALVERYKVFLACVAADPEQRLSEIPLLTTTEQRRLIVAWNATRRNHERSRDGLAQLFEHQVDAIPSATALIDGSSQVTFSELDRRANRLGRYLRGRGVRAESVVAICLENNVQVATTVLAVIKAGGAFLVIDRLASYEYSRLILDDARPAILITTSSNTLAEGFVGIVITLDTESRDVERELDGVLDIVAQPESLACIVYTSGSTGRPKGVAIQHRLILNRLYWMWSRYPFQFGEKCCQRVPPNFIDFVWELFGPLLAGTPVVLISTEALVDARTLVDLLASNGVTRIWVFPSFLRTLLETLPDIRTKLPSLSFWVSTGEALTPDLVQRFATQLPGASLFNLYGTSEVWDATWSSAYDPLTRATQLSIGSPIDNVRCYIVDRHMNVLPRGMAGELCIAGAGVSRGYWNRPEATAERFVPDPFSGIPGARMYRTGDLACWSQNGSIDFLGRMDRQIKLRGVRIELGALEHAINCHPDVQAAVVTPEQERGTMRLHAYVVTRTGTAPKPADLDELLKVTTPGHVVPASYTFLQAFPALPNGKLDRTALFRDEADESAGNAGCPPDMRTNSTQEEIAAIWRGVLHVGQVGLDDSFFNLGGHSLLLMRVYQALPERTRQRVTIVDLFKYPTVRALAAFLDGADVHTRAGDTQ